MFRRVLILTGWMMAVTAFAATASTSKWKVSGKVGVTGGSGSDVGLQGGILAEYALSTRLSWRTDLNFWFPDLTQMDKVRMNVPSNILWYPLGSQAAFCPYLGPGINVVVPLNTDFSAGFNGVFGASFQLPKKPRVGIEARYTVPDMTVASKGGWELALTGSWQLEF